MSQLSLIEKAFLLKKTKLFGELSLDLLMAISERMPAIELDAGEIIFQKEQNAHRMYLIVEGSVEIFSGDSPQHTVLLHGEFFGDESVFNEKVRGYTAKAAEDCTLLALSRTDILAILSECPSVGIALLQAYSAHFDFRPRQ